MQLGQGTIAEILLMDGGHGLRLRCETTMIPAAGQYLLAHALSDPHAPLAVPLFPASHDPAGFTAAPPLPATWLPGSLLALRGPLGHGFDLPAAARRVALGILGPTSARLEALLAPALQQGAEVALACARVPAGLPPSVEVVPEDQLAGLLDWADYAAVDLPRARLGELLAAGRGALAQVQVLVETPLPCGGLGECGACAVRVRKGWKMACRDGPVFALDELES